MEISSQNSSDFSSQKLSQHFSIELGPSIPRFSSKDHSYRGAPLGDSENDNRGQMMKTRFLISQLGEETGNCHHHASTCKRKCPQDCCHMYRSERNAELTAKMCKFCHDEFYSPRAFHYVADPENPLKDTCYNVLMKRDFITCHQCRRTFYPFTMLYEHYEDVKRARGCLLLMKNKPQVKRWRKARNITHKMWKRVRGGVKDFGKQIENGISKMYNKLRGFLYQ